MFVFQRYLRNPMSNCKNKIQWVQWQSHSFRLKIKSCKLVYRRLRYSCDIILLVFWKCTSCSYFSHISGTKCPIAKKIELVQWQSHSFRLVLKSCKSVHGRLRSWCEIFVTHTHTHTRTHAHTHTHTYMCSVRRAELIGIYDLGLRASDKKSVFQAIFIPFLGCKKGKKGSYLIKIL